MSAAEQPFSGFGFENVRLEDWYSLTQLMQPVDGVTRVSFQDVAAPETPAMVPSVLKGSIHGVTIDNVGLNGTAVHGANGVEVLDGADLPSVLNGAPQVTVTAPTGLVKPRQRVRFQAVAQTPGMHFHWYLATERKCCRGDQAPRPAFRPCRAAARPADSSVGLGNSRGAHQRALP